MTLSDDIKERIIIAIENCEFSDKKIDGYNSHQ